MILRLRPHQILTPGVEKMAFETVVAGKKGLSEEAVAGLGWIAFDKKKRN